VSPTSGIDREGKPRATKRRVMCKRGNDLVRRYLYMAALSAIQCNPAVRPLYLRVLAKHPDKAAIAVGHAMRKLLHLALAVWKTGQPFNPEHYDWGQAAQRAPTGNRATAAISATSVCATPTEQSPQAAGHKVPPMKTERSAVTAACGTPRVNDLPVTGNSPPTASGQPASPTRYLSRSLPADTDSLWIDFNHLKTQLSLERLLAHWNLLADLRGLNVPCWRCQVDTVFQDLHIDGIRWRSWNGELHY
jgi:Transposase IS116/IS110/IS902 family